MAIHEERDGADAERVALTSQADLFAPSVDIDDWASSQRRQRPASWRSCFSSPTGKTSYWWASLQLAMQYVRASIARDSHGFCVGLFTVALVVAFTSLVQSAVDNSPVVFLKLSEDTAGEGDLVLQPDFSNSVASLSSSQTSGIPPGLLLNDTELQQVLAQVPSVAGVAPRWVALGRVYNHEANTFNTSAILLVIDSERETSIGLGRSWNRRPLGAAEVYTSLSAADEVRVEGGIGQQVDVELPLSALLGAAGVSTASGATSSPETFLALLSAFGVSLGSPDGVGGRYIDVDAEALLRALVENPLLQALGFIPSQIPPIGLVRVNITALLEASLTTPAAGGATNVATSLLNVRQTMTVVEAIEFPSGKWPTFLGNVVVMEARHVAEWLGGSLAQGLQQILDTLSPLEGAVVQTPGLQNPFQVLRGLRDAASAFGFEDFRQYALQEYVVLNDRMSLYLGESNAVNQRISEFAGDVRFRLGLNYPVTVTAPLAVALESTQFIKLFLDQVFGTVVFLLGLLGAFVIFALVVGNVEEKTYEYGMLRALGLRQSTLTQVLGVTSAYFSVPGIIAGLVVGSILHGVLVGVFYALTATFIPGSMSTGAWALGIVLGVVMPAAANIIPIRRALSSSLRDSLDLYHQTINEVVVRVKELSDIGVSPVESVIAIVLVVVGFVTFYVLPQAFASLNFVLFLSLLSAVLVGMLLGLTVIGSMLQPLMETSLSTMILSCCRASDLATVVRRNLAGHRRRNSKTAFMVSISIAFLIFAGTMFALQTESIASNFRLFLGSDIVVIAPSVSTLSDTGVAGQSPSIMPQAALEDYLRPEVARSQAIAATVPAGASPAGAGALILDYSFITQPLSSVSPVFRSNLGPLTLDPSRRASVYGVQRNYLHVAYDDFTVMTETLDGQPQPDPIAQLFTTAGKLGLPIERSQPLGQVVDLTSGPGQRGWFGCGVDSWDEAAAQGGAQVVYSSWSTCGRRCSTACFSLPEGNATLVDQVARLLYTDYVGAIGSEAVRHPLSVNTKTGASLEAIAQSKSAAGRASVLSIVKFASMASKLAGFSFSPYRQVATGSPVLVRAQDMAKSVNKAASALDAKAGTPALQEAWGGAVPEPYRRLLYQRALIDGLPTAGASAASNSSRNIAYPPATPAWTSGVGRNWTVPASSVDQPLSQPDVLDATFTLQSVSTLAASYDGINSTVSYLPIQPSTPLGGPWIRLSPSPACPLVSGVRFLVSSQGRSPLSVRVEASSSASLSAFWTTVASGDLHTAGDGWTGLTWEGFSASHWRVVFTRWSDAAASPPAPSGRAGDAISIPEVELLAQAGSGTCQAELVSSEQDDSAPEIPKQRLMVRLYPGAGPKVRSRVVNAIRNVLPDDSFQVQDTQSLLTSAQVAIEGLNAFFYIVAVICLVLCFFATWLSFEANIREGSREIGVLRALGLTKVQIRTIIAVEAISVVLGAFITGSVIGMAISISLTLQFNLFTQLPFIFRFPTAIFVGTLLMCALVAVLGSLLPLRRFLQAEIAPVAKGREQ
jgi:ABC-type antimicrobial peptide transport system permease subunit